MAKKSFKQWLKDNKNALFIGVIGSLLWQIINYIINMVPNIGTNLIETIENMFYSLASVISIEYMINILFSFFLGVIMGIGFFKLFDFIIRKIIAVKNRLFQKKEGIKTDLEVLKEELNKCLNVMTVLSIVLSLIVGFDMLTLKKKMQFDLDMTSIKPYITNQEYDLLMSKWAQMKNRKEYEEIYYKIEGIQKEKELLKSSDRLK